MKEYGGFIEFEYFGGKEYHENAIALNSGRHCLEYLIKAKNIRKIYLPYFLCDSIFSLCQKLDVCTEFYHIDINFKPLLNKPYNDGWLYIVNYYGQLSDSFILDLKNKFPNIIIDNAQDFFRMPLENIDTCYTCRKFFGVADGGYLYTDARLPIAPEQDYSYGRMEYLFGRMEKGANEFYPQYVQNNKMFATEALKVMSKATQNIMRALNYNEIICKRTENFTYFHNCFKDINKLNLTVPQGAFMYPLYIENGDIVRQKLRDKKIYIPTLWPFVFDICDQSTLEYNLAKNILPLPIDHRYNLNDMKHIEREIKLCIG